MPPPPRLQLASALVNPSQLGFLIYGRPTVLRACLDPSLLGHSPSVEIADGAPSPFSAIEFHQRAERHDVSAAASDNTITQRREELCLPSNPTCHDGLNTHPAAAFLQTGPTLGLTARPRGHWLSSPEFSTGGRVTHAGIPPQDAAWRRHITTASSNQAARTSGADASSSSSGSEVSQDPLGGSGAVGIPGSSSAPPFRVSGGSRGGSSGSSSPEEEFSFVQVGRPVRTRIPITSTPSTSTTPSSRSRPSSRAWMDDDLPSPASTSSSPSHDDDQPQEWPLDRIPMVPPE
ncbi:hypothetical protein Agub_g5570, partial [Astrephomene gubernaculifera]